MQISWFARSVGPSPEEASVLPRDQFLDFAQLLLAEEHFRADEEGRRAERAALDGDLRVLDQLRLDVGLQRAREQFCGIEAGRRKGLLATSGSSIFFGSTHM